MKKISLFPILVLPTLLWGCSNDNVNKEQATQQLMSAINHLFEANSLQAQGTIDIAGEQTDYTIQLDQNDGVSLALVGAQGDDSIDFYIKDGKTYLDFLGTKSSSIASNIGLNEGDKISVFNPLLNMTTEERDDLFESVTLKDDTYTYSLNKSDLDLVLDSYGGITTKKADLSVVFDENKELKQVDFTFNAQISMDGINAPVTMSFSATIDSMNQPVTVQFPEDLSSWPQSE